MIVLDDVTAAAVKLAAAEYIAASPASQESLLLGAHIGPMGILTPSGAAVAPELVDAYAAVAEVADRMAAEAPSTGDELAMRRAAAHLRQASRLMAGSARTQRIPRISDEEAAQRIRAGYHRDEVAAAQDLAAEMVAERADTRTALDPRRRQEIPTDIVELARGIASGEVFVSHAEPVLARAGRERLAAIKERHVALQPIEDDDPIEVLIDLGGES